MSNIHYLAGLFDGEGTVTLSKRAAKDIYRTPVLSMTSTTRLLCEVLQQAFGGWIVHKKQRASHHKDAWHWYCSGDKAIDAMSQLRPLILEPQKAARMEYVINRYKVVTARNGRYSEQQREWKEEFERRFFTL